MKKNPLNIRTLTTAAITGAAYAVLTMLFAPISYGPLQFRLSELLCILPFFMPCTTWGLFLGCAIANILTGNIFDIIFGSLATLAAGLCTAAIGRRGQNLFSSFLGCLMPVIFNALVVGAVITAAYNGLNIFRHFGVFALNAAQVGLGEAVVLLAAGLPLMRSLSKKQFFREFMEKVNS